MSSDIASSNLRKFSACLDWSDCNWMRVSLVTPSTSRATLWPNRRSMSSKVAWVSSMVSCSRAVMIESPSSLNPVRIPATSTGCEKYGSPEARSCEPCILTA